MSDRVEKILANYAGENPGVIGNLRRLMNTGRLAGTGKLVILPVDQGFEHGPARSFAPNPPGYDPGLSSCARGRGGLQRLRGAARLHRVRSRPSTPARLPLILKVNNSDSLGGPEEPCSALTSSVDDALRLGCAAIGYTIYPGSGLRNQMFQDLRDLINEARAVGLPTIVWSYPRGSGLSKDGETAIDVVAYAAQIACQLGAHVVKVKPPTEVGLPGRGQEELREHSHRDAGRAHSAYRPGGLQRQTHRHLLRWRGQGHRSPPRRGRRDRQGRRLRLDRRPQCLPAFQRGCRQASARHHGYLRRAGVETLVRL